MSKIEIVCLGGQDEKDKICTALIIDEDIYVLGCGINCLNTSTLGIKKIITDFSFLIDNQSRIKGIFIPTSNYEMYGGLEFLQKYLNNIPIYVSDFGQAILNNFFENQIKNKYKKIANNNPYKTKFNIINVKPLQSFKLGKVEIMPFRTACFMPQSLGFIFKTNSGSIVFIDQFIVSTKVNHSLYDMLNEINKFAQNKVLLLIVSVGQNINNMNFTSPNYNIAPFYENCILDMQYRGIFAINEYDIYKILVLISLATKKSIPIYIYSGSFIKAFSFLQQNKIVNFSNLIYIKEDQINKIERGIIIVLGNRQELFNKLQKIIMGEDQKLSFKPTDIFVYSLLTIPGFEKHEANLFDNLNRLNVSKIIKLPKNIIPLSQSQEDHKFLVNLLKPKYIIPINDLYMNLFKYKEICKSTFVPLNNVLLLSNGQFAQFENEKLINLKQHIKIIEQYIGNSGLYDVGANGLYECQQMANNGCILCSLLIDKKEKQIKHYNYNVVGVIDQTDEKNKNIINEININLNNLIIETLKQIPQNSSLSRDQQDYFKKQIIKQYEKKFDKSPLVLLTIIYANKP